MEMKTKLVFIQLLSTLTASYKINNMDPDSIDSYQIAQRYFKDTPWYLFDTKTF